MFKKPKINGYFLDHCKNWGSDCGQPAADAFCKSEGFSKAGVHAKWNDPGVKTQTIGDSQVFDAPSCDSFSYIVCTPKKGLDLDASSETDIGSVGEDEQADNQSEQSSNTPNQVLVQAKNLGGEIGGLISAVTVSNKSTTKIAIFAADNDNNLL